jgi:hypothetical protein
MLYAQNGDDLARMGGTMPGSATKFLHHLRPHLSRNTFNSLTMGFDFVVGEGYCIC